MDRPIPVTLVTGFLGSGKTTLVRRWLEGATRGGVAVIVNELGSVGIDGDLLSAHVREVVEIAGGCICCSTQTELIHALVSLSSNRVRPLRIVIETSGAASPSGVVHAIASASARGLVVLDGIVTVLDGRRIASVLASHDLAIEQLGYADIAVVSKSDQLDDNARAAAVQMASLHSPLAEIVTASHGRTDDPSLLTLDALLSTRTRASTPTHVATKVHAVYDSVSLVEPRELDGERFAAFMETNVAPLSGRLFRTKGILAIRGLAERMLVQGVSGDVEITFGPPWSDEPKSSRLVLVGYALERETLTRAFADCAALRD